MKGIIVILLSVFLHLGIAQDVYEFPDDFLFGVATASYQVEGAWDEGGKGESIWDYMTHTFPETIADRSNGDIACDAYHKTEEDVQLLVELGVQFYRFSFSWPRILPTGHKNSINQEGLDYYHNLIDTLLANGIMPVPTMFHWDLPQSMQELGGWTNPLIVDYFVDFVDVLYQEYASKVGYWGTINEPASVCNGYSAGGLAPGYTQDGIGSYLCAHHLILAHARSYHLFQDNYKNLYPETKIGLVINSRWNEALDAESDEDQAAADRRMQWTLGIYAHPIYSEEGDYPPIMRERIDDISLNEEGYPRSRLPYFSQEEVELIRGSADFFGLNHYTSGLCSPLDDSSVSRPSNTYDSGVDCIQDPSWGDAQSSWLKVYPEGLRKLLVWIKDNYDNPDVIILENGYSDDGTLVDCNRIDYYNSYLQQVLYAMIDDGCNVFGYTAWSFMDNFEWNQGYTEKFGLVNVDFDDANRTRTPKTSYYVYKNIIEQRRIDPESACSSRN